MAHFVMIESWVGASGNLLPPLLHQLGHTYTFVTRKPEHYQSAQAGQSHPLFRYASQVLRVETNDLAVLIPFLQQQHAQQPFDAVITVCDYYIETVIAVAQALGLGAPFPRQVAQVRQKHLLRQALDYAELPNVRYRLAHSWPELQAAANQLGYPCVLKPVDLASSAYVSLIQNEQELASAYQNLGAFRNNFRDQAREQIFLLEEYLAGPEFSVESYSFQGRTSIIGITDKSVTGSPYFIENGHMFPANLDAQAYSQLCEYVLAVLDALDFEHGIAHTEVKLTAQGPRIIEVNPRTPGNYIVELIEQVTGLNLLELFVKLALQQDSPIVTQQITDRSAAIAFLVAQQAGTIESVQGADQWASKPDLLRWDLQARPGLAVAAPIDNTAYLGYVISRDEQGLGARAIAEAAISAVAVRYQA
jgi:biotin carboxylase